MRTVVSLLFLGVVAHSQPIQSVSLDPDVVIEVPVATNRVTTLSFPGPISAIDAANVTVDPSVPAEFHLAHTKGSSFFSLRALRPRASANLNVRWSGQTYVFQLVESRQPALSLNLGAPARPEVPERAPRLTPTQLLALLDKAKAFTLLKTQQPDALGDVEFRTPTNAITRLDGFEIHVEEIYRFNAEDTLVFRAQVVNSSKARVTYRPDSFQVRVGLHRYPQSISDASGEVPAESAATVYFAITGMPDGGRADLSIDNDFHALVSRP